MKIVEKDFRLTRVSESSTFFDLELLLPVYNKDKKETRMDFKTVAYGLPLHQALIRVAMNRADQSDKTDLGSYITRFENACNELSLVKIK